MNNLKTGYLTIEIEPNFQQIALQFAKEQSSIAKGKQVYLNTLAVLTLAKLLEESSFEPDLDLSDSWNPAVRCFRNVADLVIPDIGNLECLPIVEDTERVVIPQEARNNRIVYAVILLSESLDHAQLLGFSTVNNPADSVTEISLAELKPIENLIDYLFDLELANNYLLSNDEVAIKVRGRLQSNSISDIAAQFERIIRTVDSSQQQDRGVNVLAELMGITIEPELVLRSPDLQADNSERKELENLAQSLLDKLRDIWAIEQSQIDADPALNSALEKWNQLKQQQDEVVLKLSKYLGNRKEEIVQLLRESIYIEDKYDRCDRALEFLVANDVSSGFRNSNEIESSSSETSMTTAELLDLVEQLWDRLGI